jgi:hypothetical protein
MKRFSVYFLQTKAHDGWETLERSQSVAVLQGRLADLLGDGGDAEIRLVGAAFDADRREWDYTQIFYVDQGSVDLAIGDDGADADDWDDRPAPVGSGHQDDEDRFAAGYADETENVVRFSRDDDAPRAGETARSDEEPRLGRPETSRRDSDEADEEAGKDDLPPWSMPDAEPLASDDDEKIDDEAEGKSDEEGEIAPWLRKAASGGAGLGPPPVLQRRRRGLSILKAVIAALLLTLLLVVAGVAGLIFMREPTTLGLMHKLGLDHVVDMIPGAGMMSHGESGSHGSSGAGGDKTAMDKEDTPMVEPLTTGQVVRYLGVDPQLRGRWSAGKCETDYIEFTSNGYRRAIDGHESRELMEVDQTLVDEFTYFLRRSPTLVEHFENLGPNRIKLSGVTTEAGLLPSGPDSPILSRCR